MKIDEHIIKPTKPSLLKEYDKLDWKEKVIIYIITRLNYNLFVFMAGVFASYAINLLTSLLSYHIVDKIHFYLYLSSIMFSFALTSSFIAFTIRDVEIQDRHSRETNIEKFVNLMFESCIKEMRYLVRELFLSIIFALLTFVSIIACFIRANI
jgi:hypothetical protein